MVRGHLGVSIVAMTDRSSTESSDITHNFDNITSGLSEYNISGQTHHWSIYRVRVFIYVRKFVTFSSVNPRLFMKNRSTINHFVREA